MRNLTSLFLTFAIVSTFLCSCNNEVLSEESNQVNAKSNSSSYYASPTVIAQVVDNYTINYKLTIPAESFRREYNCYFELRYYDNHNSSAPFEQGEFSLATGKIILDRSPLLYRLSFDELVF